MTIQLVAGHYSTSGTATRSARDNRGTRLYTAASGDGVIVLDPLMDDGKGLGVSGLVTAGGSNKSSAWVIRKAATRDWMWISSKSRFSRPERMSAGPKMTAKLGTVILFWASCSTTLQFFKQEGSKSRRQQGGRARRQVR